MIYRPGKLTDLPALTEITNAAIKDFQRKNINQWQKGEPNEATHRKAILDGTLHVLNENGRILAMLVVVPGPDPGYRIIDGAWLNNAPYYVFHRAAVHPDFRGQGLAGKILSSSERLAAASGCKNIRVDTHPDNLAMQHALEKNGYIRCGAITLSGGSEDGDPRIGYQKILN